MTKLNLCNEPHMMGAAHDIAVVLGISPFEINTEQRGFISLTHAQARRLLALAIRAAEAERSPWLDDKGTTIQVGDTVQVLYVNTDRGAHVWMHRGEVVGFGRTRVKVKFPSRGAVMSVGPECLRVVAP